jgi:predicted O-methyltransferase YrrM
MPDILSPDTLNYLNSLKRDENPLILEMEQYARENYIPILDKNSASLLEILVTSSKAKTILEIGTAIGYTTIRLASALSDDGKIYTIEKSTDMIPLAEQNFEKSGLSKKIVLLKGDAVRKLLKLDVTFDLIFLDADKQDYARLFEISLPLLKKGGLYVTDNLLWHGYTSSLEEPPSNYIRSTELIREFNNIFFNHKALKSSLIPIGDGLGIACKLTGIGEDNMSGLQFCFKNFNAITAGRLEEANDIHTLLELAIENNLEKNFINLCFDAKYMIGLGSSIAKAEENPEITAYGTMRDDLNKTILKFLQCLREILSEADEETQLFFINKYLQQNDESDEMEDLLRLVNDFAEFKIILNDIKRA